jgi:hypothetical protein
MASTFVTKGRHFKFKLPDEGLRIEAGHVAQVPLVVEGFLGTAQTGDLIQGLDGNTTAQDVVFNVNQDGQIEAGARFTISVNILAAAVDQYIWTCPAGRTARILAANEVHTALDATETCMPRKAEGTEIPASGQALLTGAFALSSTNATVVNGTLTATDADRVFAAGDRLALDFNGAMDTYAGAFTFDMVYES